MNSLRVPVKRIDLSSGQNVWVVAQDRTNLVSGAAPHRSVAHVSFHDRYWDKWADDYRFRGLWTDTCSRETARAYLQHCARQGEGWRSGRDPDMVAVGYLVDRLGVDVSDIRIERPHERLAWSGGMSGLWAGVKRWLDQATAPQRLFSFEHQGQRLLVGHEPEGLSFAIYSMESMPAPALVDFARGLARHIEDNLAARPRASVQDLDIAFAKDCLQAPAP